MTSDILDLTPHRARGAGRPSKPLVVEVVRPLNEADIALLGTQRAVKPPVHLKKLRDSHHRVARCFAAGLSNLATAAQTGYSLGRLVTLKQDPAFCDLVKVYAGAVAEEFAAFTDIATANMIRGERMIEDSLEEADEAGPLPLAELRPVMEIVADRADRFGHPRHNTSLNVNVDFAGRLEAARRRSGIMLGAPTASAAAPEKEPVEDVA